MLAIFQMAQIKNNLFHSKRQPSPDYNFFPPIPKNH